MDIRWEDGEEISTSIDLQKRILERMQFEKELEITEAAQKIKKAKASTSKGGKHFAGLEDTDFSNTCVQDHHGGVAANSAVRLPCG